jgi:hypothetical protein
VAAFIHEVVLEHGPPAAVWRYKGNKGSIIRDKGVDCKVIIQGFYRAKIVVMRGKDEGTTIFFGSFGPREV